MVSLHLFNNCLWKHPLKLIRQFHTPQALLILKIKKCILPYVSVFQRESVLKLRDKGIAEAILTQLLYLHKSYICYRHTVILTARDTELAGKPFYP